MTDELTITTDDGEETQIDIAIEELSELTTELARWQRGRESIENIQEEIADVQLCLNQLKRMYGEESIKEQKGKKLQRLKRRVENDKTEEN